MNITNVPVNPNQIVGLGENSHRYIDAVSGETLGFITVREGDICFFSYKVIPLKELMVIVEDAKQKFLPKPPSLNF